MSIVAFGDDETRRDVTANPHPSLSRDNAPIRISFTRIPDVSLEQD